MSEKEEPRVVSCKQVTFSDEHDALAMAGLRYINSVAPDHFGEQDVWAKNTDTCSEPDACKRCIMLQAAVEEWWSAIVGEGA